MYFLTISSLTSPIVSVKYPFAKKLSPYKNSSISGYSFLKIRLVPPLEYLDHLSHAVLRRNMDHDMEMLILNSYLTYPPLVHATGIIKKFLEANGNFALQYTFPIFGNPYQMVLKPMFRMSPIVYLAITRLCLICLHFASFAGFVPRNHSSPRLESLGFSGNYINSFKKGRRGCPLLPFPLI